MGDTARANRMLASIKKFMADFGDTRTFRLITDDEDPLASSQTTEDVSVELVLFEFDIKYMPDSTVINGETMAVLDISSMTDAQKAKIDEGCKIVDGSEIYEVTKLKPVEFAGVIITYFLQLKD